MLGASMAGLLAAGVLTEFYDRVTIIERDELDDSAAPRRGVPQSRQPHVVLARCVQVMEDIFPGITAEIVDAGAHEWCDGDLSRFYTRFGGHLSSQTGHIPDPTSLRILYASRPFIESHVRRRVRALPVVTVLDGHDLDMLISAGGEVVGARVTSRADHSTTDLYADLVVDATGRGSRTPSFLQEMGYARPREDQLAVNISYVSMPVRIPDGVLHEYLFLDLFQPGRPYGFALSRCEFDHWSVLIGSLGKHVPPPASVDEFFGHAKQLMPEYVYDAVRNSEPLAELALHRFPASRWRRYDQLRRLPEGLLVTGDAVASFNPIYGQGMTIAAIDAMVLRDCLLRGPQGLQRRFHRAAARGIQVAWRTAVGSDLALPEVEGKRTMSTKLTNAYIDRVLRASQIDPFVTQQFQRVTGMLEPPTALLKPAMLRRVLQRAPNLESSAPAAISATA
ncbi:FAD-dependent monooxygenase [Mycobacterium sp. 236(2023)]|uniref:FAD-dependent oxidoreductase n=1 Tax=Mycobacterium sp. 236(2023) TaxID=3038163 RepID=UPI002414F005|nr:FAD-dependent monooxygenase [Mycobacterium sp. 236(2023)]MDG4663413.1 FAD-binding protein [Mycobacterium sp. 236(2023)]